MRDLLFELLGVEGAPGAPGGALRLVESELWRVFTTYTVQSNPCEIRRLPSQGFLRLLRETRLVKTVRDEAEAQICISARGCGKNLCFAAFIETLARLAVTLDDGSMSPEAAFRAALLENVFPLAACRPRENMIIDDTSKKLLKRFQVGFDEIFEWYRLLSESERRRRSKYHRGKESSLCRCCRRTKTKEQVIEYGEYVRFCAFFELFEGPASNAKALLSIVDVAEAFVDSTSSSAIDRDQFDLVLLRLAKTAFVGHDDTTALKSLFVSMWQATSAAVPLAGRLEHFRKQGAFVTAQQQDSHPRFPKFTATFLDMWHTDNYEIYHENHHHHHHHHRTKEEGKRDGRRKKHTTTPRNDDEDNDPALENNHYGDFPSSPRQQRHDTGDELRRRRRERTISAATFMSTTSSADMTPRQRPGLFRHFFASDEQQDNNNAPSSSSSPGMMMPNTNEDALSDPTPRGR